MILNDYKTIRENGMRVLDYNEERNFTSKERALILKNKCFGIIKCSRENNPRKKIVEHIIFVYSSFRETLEIGIRDANEMQRIGLIIKQYNIHKDRLIHCCFLPRNRTTAVLEHLETSEIKRRECGRVNNVFLENSDFWLQLLSDEQVSIFEALEKNSRHPEEIDPENEL